VRRVVRSGGPPAPTRSQSPPRRAPRTSQNPLLGALFTLSNPLSMQLGHFFNYGAGRVRNGMSARRRLSRSRDHPRAEHPYTFGNKTWLNSGSRRAGAWQWRHQDSQSAGSRQERRYSESHRGQWIPINDPENRRRLRDQPRRANVSTTGAGAGFTNLKTPSNARNAIDQSAHDASGQEALLRDRTVCVSDGMNFSSRDLPVQAYRL